MDGTVALEGLVLAHGALVAYVAGNALWPMFAFGFGAVVVVTQLHGLGPSRGIRLLVGGGYVTLVAVVYAGRGWDRLNEVVRIPAIEYLAVVVLAALIRLGLAPARRLGWRRPPPAPAAAAAAGRP